MIPTVILAALKFIGTQALIDIAFKALEEVAKNTDNAIDDEIVSSIKSIVVRNVEEKKDGIKKDN